ncbi:MAG: hypothetical protein IJY11_01930 [Clostridia bacterium]|nr:hypothetical protein [Clostridia bacterium]
MLVSSIIGKHIYEKGTCKGRCNGVLLSPKSHTLKYLSCRDESNFTTFFLPFSQVDYVTDAIKLKRFCAASPLRFEKFSIGAPVYDENGVFVGEAADLEVLSSTATQLILTDGNVIPAPMIATCHDAVILRKTPPFPLSRRIPAHAKALLDDKSKKEAFVTKNALLGVIKKGNLIRFTLALSPFSPALDDVFCRKF